ncbi:TonB family protein [Piscinibacter aquaticus]|uniref:TonB family protein n=1 Tax=Piscinibacter aquaticus TaxID=392597 RepID=A0A5C6U396_9BURK|nr:TonB family protein [Piscinibacter aquaticus]
MALTESARAISATGSLRRQADHHAASNRSHRSCQPRDPGCRPRRRAVERQPCRGGGQPSDAADPRGRQDQAEGRACRSHAASRAPQCRSGATGGSRCCACRAGCGRRTLATSESPTAPAPGLAESTVATVEAAAVPRSPEPAAAPVATAAPQTQPEPAEALPPLKLRSLVEPITPRHLAGRLRGEVRVEVQLNVAADGSVSEAAVMASSHPQMNAAVLDAVRQWRYEPAGRAREHAVQVVLRPDS